jgi:predicted AAA+ superfamily ATPase
MIRGSLPELWKEPSINPFEFYRTYLATYLERDVRQILNVSSLRDFERFIRVSATRNGQILNKTDIAKDVGVSMNTINQWLSLLEASNQITLLEPYFGNTGKRVVKSPKIYFNEISVCTRSYEVNNLRFLMDIVSSKNRAAYCGSIQYSHWSYDSGQ